MLIATLDRYPGYEFREDGSVWSYRKRGDSRSRTVRLSLTPRKLKCCVKRDGYVYVKLRSVDWSRSSVLLHRLILEAFHGPCPDGMQGCHNNGRGYDCRLSNLRWDTPKSNNADKLAHGTHRSGENMPWAKLTNKQAIQARWMWATGTYTYTQLGRVFGVTREAMRQIILELSYKEIA